MLSQHIKIFDILVNYISQKYFKLTLTLANELLMDDDIYDSICSRSVIDEDCIITWEKKVIATSISVA